MLDAAQFQQFKIDGYLRLPKLLDDETIKQIRSVTDRHLENRIEPFELEAAVQYPGSPVSEDAQGGETIRRLLNAYHRDTTFQQCATHPTVVKSIKQILACDQLLLNPNHHNCIMTKQPSYSSRTEWHRDTRYWSFSNKYLINAWFALGEELEPNGAIKILPGSHRWDVQDDALDELQFLKPDHPFNIDRIQTERLVTLNAGDVLLFSAHCFHAAGRNKTNQAKYSLVFTYHDQQTKPVGETKSSVLDEISVAQN